MKKVISSKTFRVSFLIFLVIWTLNAINSWNVPSETPTEEKAGYITATILIPPIFAFISALIVVGIKALFTKVFPKK